MTFIVVTPPVSERARNAVLQARKLLPQWAAFARMLARKRDLKVVLTGGTPCTDGQTVWLRPPILLGDNVPHDKSTCSTRGADKIMLCPACRTLDEVNTTIFHEMAHIIHGSFEEVPEDERLDIITEAIRLECSGDDETSRAAKITKRIEDNKHSINSWIMAANYVSPYLPMLLNAVEDVWVNTEMMEARPGTRVMFSAQTTSVFEHGIETDAGVVKWSEQPLNAQAIIGVYCLGSGLDFNNWLDPEVVKDLSDTELRLLAGRIQTSRTAKARYQLAIRLLERLRQLGYLLSEDDPEDEESGEGEPDPDAESEEGESGASVSVSTPSESDDESDDESEGGGGGSDDEESDEDDSDDDSEDGSETGDGDDVTSTGKDADPEDSGDESESSDVMDAADFGDETGETTPSKIEGDIELDSPPMGDPGEVEDLFKIFGRHDDDDTEPTPEEEQENEEVERAVEQAEHFDEAAYGIDGLKVYRADDADLHRVFSGSGRNLDSIPETILSPSLVRLRLAFADNRKGRHERNLKRGRRLDRKVMGRRIATEDPRIFSRRSLPGRKDYFVVIGLDVSGSTASGKIHLIKEAGLAQAELLSRLRIPFALYCHSGDYEGVEIFEIKGPNEPWSDKTRGVLARVRAYSANLDGHTLEFYRKRAEEYPATDKLIMYYTDGAMPLENYDEELRVLQHNIELCKKLQISLVGVGIQNDDPIKHGLDTIRMDGIEDLPRVIEGLAKRLI